MPVIRENRPTHARLVKDEATAANAMVATKHRLATEAGLAMLEAGGNAVDAAVAACFTVSVVEPESSSIGGGGYLVYQMNGKGGVIGFPMRAPAAVAPDMYRLTGAATAGVFGWPGVEGEANIEGVASVAAPGSVAGLCEAHRRFGRLPLTEVTAPAVAVARDGFTLDWHERYVLGLQAGKLHRYDELRRTFTVNGELPGGPASDPVRLRQPDLAAVLERIGREGAGGFHKGEVAAAVAEGVRAMGGILSESDLAAYRPRVWEQGLEVGYRGLTVRVPPYACAGITSAMTLRLLEKFDVAALGHGSVEGVHAYVCAARLAYADRFAYMSDPDFVDAPWQGLLSDGYIAKRRALIDDRAHDFASGDPWEFEGRRPAEQLPESRPAWDTGTTHLCVIDGEGNAVSLTNTIMSGFGSGVVPPGTGVVMNNGMMWFDPVPGRVNSIAPGKAALNNMTPALAIDGGEVVLALGASGGRLITNCVTQALSNVVDHGMGPQEAVDAPRVDASTPWTSVDHRLSAEVIAGLEAKGHRLKVIPRGLLDSGYASFASPLVIQRDAQGLRAGADAFHSAYAAGL